MSPGLQGTFVKLFISIVEKKRLNANYVEFELVWLLFF